MATPSDADRYASMELALSCPGCGASGLIPWDRLDRVLGCRRCLTMYRVEPHGLVIFEPPADEEFFVEVRSGASEWQKHKVVVYRVPGRMERLRDFLVDLPTHWRGRLALATAAVILISCASAQFASDAQALPAAVLPDSLPERAIVLAEAVAHRDTNLLIQLTDPSQHRALRIWLAHGNDLPKAVPIDSTDIRAELLTKVDAKRSSDVATTQVLLQVAPDGEEFVLTEQWVRRADTWYFRPARLRSPAPIKSDTPTRQRLHGVRR
jgi:hypothetical protein